MANIATVPTLPTSFSRGFGLQVDNMQCEVVVINHDGSTTVTINSTKLKRIYRAVFIQWDGTILTPTVTGFNSKTLNVSALPANVQGITVLLAGSRL